MPTPRSNGTVLAWGSMTTARYATLLKLAILSAFTLLGVAGGWGVAAAVSGVLHPEPAGATTADPPSNPFTHCAAAGTLDVPDPRVAGGGVDPAITATLQANGAAVEVVRWRCFEGRVYACGVAANVPCGRADQRTRGNLELRRYCQQQPNAPSVPSGVAGHRTLYHWRCEGGEPAIVRQLAHADERGFVAEYWHPVPDPGRLRRAGWPSKLCRGRGQSWRSVRPELVEGPALRWFDELTTNGISSALTLRGRGRTPHRP